MLSSYSAALPHASPPDSQEVLSSASATSGSKAPTRPAAAALSHQASSFVVTLEGYSRIETIVTLISWLMTLKESAR